MARTMRKRKPGKLRVRARRLLRFVMLWLILIAYVRRFSIERSPPGYVSKANWMSKQSMSFSMRWRNHKYRNVMVYACIVTRNVVIARRLVQYFLTCPSVFYDPRYEQLFSVPYFCFSHACLEPFGKAHFVYAEFVLETFEAITSQTISPVEPTADGKIAVLVEPREHPLLEYTIKQVMLTLGPGWSLQLFLSSANEFLVRDRLQIHTGGIGEKIVITPLGHFGLDEMSKYGNRVQSAFSAHEKMYAEIRSENILWFQVDVVMRSQVQSQWLQYAYVGAEWPGCEYPKCSAVTCSKVCSGGNSGLSLRRKSKIVRVATRGKLPENLWGHQTQQYADPHFIQVVDKTGYFASDHLHDNSKTKWFEDDLQISYKMSKLNLLPPAEVPPAFAIGQALPYFLRLESSSHDVHSKVPAGMHKPWLTPLMDPEIITELLQMPYERAVQEAEAALVFNYFNNSREQLRV